MPGSRNARRTLSVALAFALISGCSEVIAPEDADAPFRTDVVPTESWTRVERPGFSFLLPPGFEKLPLVPIDSDAAVYQSGSSSLHHDYGYYTGPWSDPGAIDGAQIRNVVRQDMRIGGRNAEVVAFRYGAVYGVRAWWGRVKRSYGMDEHLLMRIETDDAAVRAELLASIYSVRFP